MSDRQSLRDGIAWFATNIAQAALWWGVWAICQKITGISL